MSVGLWRPEGSQFLSCLRAVRGRGVESSPPRAYGTYAISSFMSFSHFIMSVLQDIMLCCRIVLLDSKVYNRDSITRYKRWGKGWRVRARSLWDYYHHYDVFSVYIYI